MFDETISSVQLELLVQRQQVNTRLKQQLAQLEALERLRPEEITQEVRARIEALERNLGEMRRQQIEIVELSIKNMFEMSSMIAREREVMLQVGSHCEEKMTQYQRAMGEVQQRMRD